MKSKTKYQNKIFPIHIILLTIIYLIRGIHGSINSLLNDYQTLHHELVRHKVTKRSLDDHHDEEKLVEFDAHGKRFILDLRRHMSPLTSDFQVVSVDARNNERIHDVPPLMIYRGHLAGDPHGSTVSAYWDHDNTMTATIKTPSETYFVEPSWRHLPPSSNYTMITYRSPDIKQDSEKPSSCGHKDHADQMSRRNTPNVQEKQYFQDERSERKRRSTCSVKPDKRSCSLLLVADYKFHVRMGLDNVAQTSNYLIGLIDEIDSSFRSQKFGDCGSGFGFQIGKIVIHEQYTVGVPGHYNADVTNWTISGLLESFGSASESKASYANFCLAHLFTAIPFATGVLGYSNVAQATSGNTGGICSRNQFQNKGYVNTGWTTAVNSKDIRVLNQQAKLVTAHEFGHNWGSFHDLDVSETCSPSIHEGGRYLMYMYSVSGMDKNNHVFSPCSLNTMTAVLNYKANICFTNDVDRTVSFCGNFRVEGSEECDEGLGTSKCCEMCKLKKNAKCCDANSECCQDCQPAPPTKVCRTKLGSSCTEQAYCTGTSFLCPRSDPKPNGVACLGGSNLCRNGECLSLCEYHNKTSCICEKIELSCKWCCRDPMDQNSTCVPFYQDNNSTSDFTNLPDDRPCAVGICKQGECKQQVQDTLQLLWNVIEIKSVEQWIKFMHNNIVGTVIVMSLLIWIPASCFISYVDRRRELEDEQDNDWLNDNTSLIQAGVPPNLKIITPSGTRERKKPAGHAGRAS